MLSWRVKKITGTQISDLGQSMRGGSEIELKDFVKERGPFCGSFMFQCWHLLLCVCVCVGGHKLEGLHKAAAQGDRGGIMHCMKVVKTCSTCIQLLEYICHDSNMDQELLSMR